MRLKIREIDIIAAVAKSKNISQAAIYLGMPQANVSKYISDLEHRIGLKIFERTSRSVTLTDFGNYLLPFIEQSLENQKIISDFIHDFKSEKTGTVIIYAPAGIMHFLCKEIIPKFIDIGSIVLSLKTRNPFDNEYFNGVIFPNDCDIMLGYAPPLDDELVSVTLSSGVCYAYASPVYLSNNPIKSPDELQYHSCILLHSALATGYNSWNFQRKGEEEVKEYRVSGRYICDNVLTASTLAHHGLGIFISPEYLVKDYLLKGELIPCFNGEYFIPYNLVAIYKRRKYLPLRISCVLDQMVNRIRNHIGLFEDM